LAVMAFQATSVTRRSPTSEHDNSSAADFDPGHSGGAAEDLGDAAAESRREFRALD
jgi:hypothetical protein